MAKPSVEICVGGRSYKVVSDASGSDLQRLAAVVDRRLGQIGSRHPDAMMLVALSLAHDLEGAQQELSRANQRSKSMLRGLIERVDGALDSVDENAERLTS